MSFIAPEIKNLAEYHTVWQSSTAQPNEFWRAVAQTLHWTKQGEAPILQGNFSNIAEVAIKWFDGWELNLCYNCLDRHLAELADKPAIIWEPNNPDTPSRTLSYRALHTAVCRFANALLALGAQAGSRVCIYMPMVPEAAIAMLACARIGAIHTVVFGGFSANSLADRIQDAGCSILITADSAYRGTKEIRLKDICEEALSSCPTIQKVIVYQHTGNAISWQSERDIWWHDALQNQPDECAALPLPAEHPLFILYTSGSTGKPKGVVHTTGGYTTYVGYTFRNVFQIQENDIYWCTADVGWITGHSYLVYGPLLNGITTLMFEGVPNYPDYGRFWEVIDKWQVNIFYTAPTAIRALEQAGLTHVQNKKLSSLRILGTVGEPINHEAWEWYHENIGKNNCPIVDTWWQTETGGMMISPLAGITPLKPTFATLPMPGIQPVLLDDKGNELDGATEGNLCIKAPWPALARTTWNNHSLFVNTYFKAYPGYYFTGDGCRRDGDGYYRITGRVDDVLNVSGHRIGTAEVEDAINQHELIVEAAVVGYPHDIKGQGIYAYVTPIKQIGDSAQLQKEIAALVTQIIGPFARPDVIQVVEALPKTRSGKIMRRILRKIAEGATEGFGDTSTLLDPSVVESIQKNAHNKLNIH